MKKIIIVGSGKLAKKLHKGLPKYGVTVIPWSDKISISDSSIIIHAGSGRQLDEVFLFCKKSRSILVELSTGTHIDRAPSGFPVIICPNTSLLTLKFMKILKENGFLFHGYKKQIVESHQSSKKSVPGTAYKYAEYLNMPFRNIKSIRDKKTQKEKLTVSERYLDLHAYHKIIIGDKNEKLEIKTQVLGHSSYLEGVYRIIQIVLEKDLKNKTYSIVDLI